MKITRALVISETKETLVAVVASIFWAVSLKMFAVPNQIAPSGFTGITVIINYLTGLPIGSMSLLLNFPLLIVCWFAIGRFFVWQTLRALVIYTVLVDVVFSSPQVYMGDPLLAAIFAGVFNGIAGGMMFMRGASGGGTDLLLKLIRKRYPYFSTGQLVMAINGVIMVMASLVYGNIEAGLYGLIMTFTSGRVMDAMLNGADAAKSVLIITHQPEKISDAIIQRLHRSATILNGTGAFKRDQTYVVMCVVRKTEFFLLKKLIREEDHDAFVIVNEANQILGRGFRAIDASDT